MGWACPACGVGAPCSWAIKGRRQGASPARSVQRVCLAAVGRRCFLPCLPPAPAAPAGGSRGARGLRPVPSNKLSGTKYFTEVCIDIIEHLCYYFPARPVPLPFGGCPWRGIHGRRKKLGRKTGLFFCPFFRLLLQQNRGSDFCGVNCYARAPQGFLRPVYFPEIVNLIFYSVVWTASPAAHPGQRNKTYVILLRSFRAGVSEISNMTGYRKSRPYVPLLCLLP